MDIEIRPFAPADLPRLHEVREAAFAPVFASFRALVGEEIASVALANAEPEQAAHLDELCAAGSKAEVYVALLDGVIVGFVSVTVDEEQRVGEIGLNAVHPSQGGLGIGTKLYELALERMRARGALVATVGTGGDASHEPARRAYEKVGFRKSIPSLYLYRKL